MLYFQGIFCNIIFLVFINTFFIFKRPSYQDTAVQEYLNTAVLPPSSYFNSSGRGYNDVGALGFNILTVKGGSIDVTGGTSASGPIFAGLVALLNDVQLNMAFQKTRENIYNLMKKFMIENNL